MNADQALKNERWAKDIFGSLFITDIIIYEQPGNFKRKNKFIENIAEIAAEKEL